MLFDKRCTEAIRIFMDSDISFREFARAVSVQTNDDNDIVVRCSIGGSEPFTTISRDEWEETSSVQSRALSSNGIYNFGKYAVYTLLFERNQVKDFINFAKKKGYTCVYTN